MKFSAVISIVDWLIALAGIWNSTLDPLSEEHIRSRRTSPDVDRIHRFASLTTSSFAPPNYKCDNGQTNQLIIFPTGALSET